MVALKLDNAPFGSPAAGKLVLEPFEEVFEVDFPLVDALDDSIHLAEFALFCLDEDALAFLCD